MRFRTPARETAPSNERPATTEPERFRWRPGLGRTLVFLSLGLVGAYAVIRFLNRSLSDVAPVSPSEVRERTTAAVPDEFQSIPIRERDVQHSSETGVDDALDAETNVDLADERTGTEIAERADETIPEPGEMAVDDDIADELVDKTEDILDGEDDDDTSDSDGD
ncbi:hypothetical protein [Halopiger djelfimassiliensis]|uniref:hypothetical protein n=1 Tax=Halopiger djelfimassiliensis TaxID=1293047 RepID=UPI000678078C|nr:hypothetical protein [Halopiger djelfimassiliensis]